MSDIKKSTARYEGWLEEQLNGELIPEDLEKKHKKMKSGPFPFFRATYWRWAEIMQEHGLKMVATAPQVPAVGDIHLENYGVWRDGDGRLVWGVNDFDEASTMPYICDLLRLAVSAALAPVAWSSNIPNICASIARGYKDGLKEPSAFVLDRDNAWLRRQFEVDSGERADFWAKIAKDRKDVQKSKDCKGKKCKDDPETKIPNEYRKALITSLPRGSAKHEFWSSDAGTGSLGRPRWVAYAEWRTAPVIREAKAVVRSAWTYPGSARGPVLCEKIASGQFRAPDPHYKLRDNVIIRRLSPNGRKLEMESYGAVLVDPRMLRLMGHELANIHLGDEEEWESRAEEIRKNLKLHWSEPFVSAVKKLTECIVKEQIEFAA